MSGGQPAAVCGHPGDDGTIVKSDSESPCAESPGALEISLRHRENGDRPEGNFGPLKEEVDSSEGNFRTGDGGLGHVKGRRATGVRGTQGNLGFWKRRATGAFGNVGDLGFRQRRRPEFAERRETWVAGTLGDWSSRRGLSDIGGRFRRRGRSSNRTLRAARPGEAPPSHAWRGLVVRSAPVAAADLTDVRRRATSVVFDLSGVRPQCCSTTMLFDLSGVRRRRCGSGGAGSAPGTASCRPARRPRRTPPRSHRSLPSRAPRRSATRYAAVS